MTARETSDPRAAFADLYRATRADLLRYLIRRCPDAEEAADLLLLRSARRRRVAFAVIERLAGELQAAQPAPTADQPRHEALRLALAELSEQDREILTLNAWEGLASREIAQVVVANAMVRIRLHRARSRVRKQLGYPDETTPCHELRRQATQHPSPPAA